MLIYPATFKTDSNGQILVTFQDIPEAVTAGDDTEDALRMAVDALETALDFYFDDKRPVPAPSKAKRNQHAVALSATATAKVLLHNEMLAQGVRKAELARRLNIAPPNVERIFSIRHATKLATIEAALAALGKRLDVRVA